LVDVVAVEVHLAGGVRGAHLEADRVALGERDPLNTALGLAAHDGDGRDRRRGRRGGRGAGRGRARARRVGCAPARGRRGRRGRGRAAGALLVVVAAAL